MPSKSVQELKPWNVLGDTVYPSKTAMREVYKAQGVTEVHEAPAKRVLGNQTLFEVPPELNIELLLPLVRGREVKTLVICSLNEPCSPAQQISQKSLQVRLPLELAFAALKWALQSSLTLAKVSLGIRPYPLPSASRRR